MTASDIEYSIVTATYNEAENIALFIDAVAAAVRPLEKKFEIIVVDDDSPDGTGSIVESLCDGIPEARLLTRKNCRGIGSAYLHGIHSAAGTVVATMDADFSHPPDALPAMLASASAGALTLGSRFLRSGDFDTELIRFIPTRSINLWHQLTLRTGVRDHTNGYVAAPVSLMKRMCDDGEAMGLPPFERILYGLILVAAARRLGIPIKEVRARYVFRTRGDTKIKFARGVKLLFEEWFDSMRLFPHTFRRARLDM